MPRSRNQANQTTRRGYRIYQRLSNFPHIQQQIRRNYFRNWHNSLAYRIRQRAREEAEQLAFFDQSRRLGRNLIGVPRRYRPYNSRYNRRR